ncbi:MAG: type II secretion system protein N [Sphaerotilus natans subsp. sulfidivorans]|uniref:type II secretion system protein N n=1 Tax=Sphaerotilus sulfidivorans TaxID=639200 RepID=UPI0023548B38|nr:type II secretion system protein N [Sphaerotilus sulfidivorans]MCK6403080.1 type II secretion system protein N [Sphaerotilus sulfidivorans]
MSRRPDLPLHSRPWRPTYQPSAGPLSTFDDALTRSRTGWVAQARSSRRWAVAGALTGALVTLPLVAPAAWLAQAVSAATRGHVLLADARGSLWAGDAVLVLTAGPGSREAMALPGRLGWRLSLDGLAAQLALRHDCCLGGEPRLIVRPGLGRVEVRVQPSPDSPDGRIGQWPAAWLVGLGTPFNTMRPGGALQLGTQDLRLTWARGRFSMEGSAMLELRDLSSRLTTLPRLGSYRLTVRSDAAQAGTAQIGLDTLDGALQLSATGSWGAGGLRLRGEASAREAERPALDNLLNIIGRRQGARSLLSIG